MSLFYGGNFLQDQSNLVIGDYGTGKTFYTVEHLFKLLGNDPFLIPISNTWLNCPHIRYYQPSELPAILMQIVKMRFNYSDRFEAHEDYHKHFDIIPPGKDEKYMPFEFFLLSDEAGIFFNARNYGKNFKDEGLLEMIAQPRKYHLTITSIAQFEGFVDLYFRRFSYSWYKANGDGFLGFYRSFSLYNPQGKDLDMSIDEPSSTEKFWNINKKTIPKYYHNEVLGTFARRSKKDITNLPDFLYRFYPEFSQIGIFE